MIAVSLIAAVLLVGTATGFWQKARARRASLTAVRADWGRVRPIERLDDHTVDEAWLALDGAAARDALDDRTWADLDLDRVLASIDHTRTGFGRQLLYRQLRSARAWSASSTLHTIAERSTKDASFREALALPLLLAGQRLGHGFWRITRPDAVTVRWWYVVFPVLAVLMLCALLAIFFDPRAVLAVALLAVINMGARVAASWQVPGLLVPMQQLGATIALAERLAAVDELPPDQARQMQQHVAQLAPLRRISWWVSRDALSAGELTAGAWEYLNLMFLLDANALLLSARHLRRLSQPLRDVAVWIGEVDMALSVASLRAEPRFWCTPQWAQASSARVCSAWHPLVDAPVANDGELRMGAGLIITGANMSGKSTYLRTLGLAAVLARTLDTCPATSWTGAAFQVRSLIGRNDDLATGKSYYQVEAEGVVEMLRQAQSSVPTLFLLDELLRGTNTVERLAAGEAVLRGLLDATNGVSPHMVVVATHDGELVSMLQELYTPVHFRETVTDGALQFDFKRHEGPATTRTAIALLQAAGASDAVVAMARRTADQLDGS